MQISIERAACVMRLHKEEILRVCRATHPKFRVMVEVDCEGEWRGANAVQRGTISVFARLGGHAAYFFASPRRRMQHVEREIEEWVKQMHEEMRG